MMRFCQNHVQWLRYSLFIATITMFRSIYYSMVAIFSVYRNHHNISIHFFLNGCDIYHLSQLSQYFGPLFTQWLRYLQLIATITMFRSTFYSIVAIFSLYRNYLLLLLYLRPLFSPFYNNYHLILF